MIPSFFVYHNEKGEVNNKKIVDKVRALRKKHILIIFNGNTISKNVILACLSHKKRGSDLTLSCELREKRNAIGRTIIKIEDTMRVFGAQHKAQNPKGTPKGSGYALVFSPSFFIIKTDFFLKNARRNFLKLPREKRFYKENKVFVHFK